VAAAASTSGAGTAAMTLLRHHGGKFFQLKAMELQFLALDIIADENTVLQRSQQHAGSLRSASAAAFQIGWILQFGGLAVQLAKV
jgi:hypothetical protein